MLQEPGYLYLLAVGEDAVLQDDFLRDPYCSAFVTSTDGKLGVMRLPVEISQITVPVGTAIRFPSYPVGAKLAQGSRWRVIPAEEFYSRGMEMPDAYALQDEVKALTERVAALTEHIADLEKEPEAAKSPAPTISAVTNAPSTAAPATPKAAKTRYTRG